MKRTVFLVFTINAMALPGDSWFGADKVKHFFLGAFVQSAAFGTLQAAGIDRNASLAGASAVTLSAVLAKELRDKRGHGTPSMKDASWGLAGAVAISPLLARTK